MEIGDLLFIDIKPILCKIFSPLCSHLIPGVANDHIAMYIGDGLFIEANYYGLEKYNEDLTKKEQYCNFRLPILTDGVQITPFFILWFWGTNFTLGKVNTTIDIKLDAVSFALDQIGKPYQWVWSEIDEKPSWRVNPNITNTTNPFYNIYHYTNDTTVDYWYCAELVWAAYLHQEINLDAYPDPDFYNLDLNEYYYGIGPDSIKFSELVNVIRL